MYILDCNLIIYIIYNYYICSSSSSSSSKELLLSLLSLRAPAAQDRRPYYTV